MGPGDEGEDADVASPELSPDEQAAMEEDVALSDAEKRRVLEMRRRAAHEDYFSVLGVEPGVTRRELKRAYFRASKEFHPDRYYGKNVGPFGRWLADIFEAASRAFETLSDDRSRAEYEASLRGDSARGSGSKRTQTPAEQARELYDRACALEVSGNAEQALPLFAAVARIDPRARYLKRAATCAMKTGELKTAEEYAKQAAHLEPRNPSFLRLLAEVYRAAGKLREAERTLVSALELRTGNDVLAAEIADDLEEVRKQL
jgi:tetratricopeptide (TPR) repeat protein